MIQLGGAPLTSGPPRLLRILVISDGDYGSWGGASQVGWNLFSTYRRRGHVARLAVDTKLTNDPDVLRFSDYATPGPWSRFWTRTGAALISSETKIRRGAGPLGRILQHVGQPEHVLNRWQGIEDFEYPESWRILDFSKDRPNIVHCHTLHGGYFDLRALPWLSSQVPVVLTLHDAWHISGLCTYHLDCERWKTGCGRCPDLNRYASVPTYTVRRDATAYNWRQKREIYRRSRLYIATPSKWLMRKVEQSILMEGAVDLRVIPNGVDLTKFRPAPKEAVRRQLGLSPDAKVLLFVAWGGRNNQFKDFSTVRAAVAAAANSLKENGIVLITIGEDAPTERSGETEFRFLRPGQSSDVVVAHLQAADIYLHAANAENSPMVIMEAMACGTPVVATSVGGIPEIVESGHTGYLVPHRDSEAMADRIEELLADRNLRERMGREAVERARYFDLNRQADTYLEWFAEICSDT